MGTPASGPPEGGGGRRADRGEYGQFFSPRSWQDSCATLAVAATHLAAGTIDLVVVIGPLACFDPWEQETSACLGQRVRTTRVRGPKRQRDNAYDAAVPGDLLILSYATAASGSTFAD